MSRKTRIPSLLLLTALFAAALSPALSEVSASESDGYMLPNQTLVDIIDARRTPWVTLGPKRQWMLLRERPGYPSIAELAERELRLAGMRFKPDQDAESRTWSANGLKLLSVDEVRGGEIAELPPEIPVAGLPSDPRIENVAWSPDGSKVAFTNTTSTGVELWMLDVEDAEARRILGPVVSMTAAIPPKWLYGSSSLVCCLVPDGRGPEPQKPAAPDGPVTRETKGEATPARTYQDLLGSTYDEELFEHYLTSQLAIVSLDGTVERIGPADMLWDVHPSPDGEYLLVSRLRRPYSYLLPAYRFPELLEVWDLDGNVVYEVADLPLRDNIPITRGSVATGRRGVEWRADAPATLFWAEALDGGDASVEAEFRDRLYLLEAPFGAEPTEWLKTELRFYGINWGHGGLALVSEYWWPTRTIRTWKAAPDDPDVAPELVVDRVWEDRYADPGQPATTRNSYGLSVLLTADDANTLYMIGEGASPEGDRPFLDSFDTVSGDTHRLFRSEAPYYERPVALLSKRGRYVITRREAVEEVPNYFLRDLASGGTHRLTDFPHPTPQLKGLSKELIRYERADGVDLTGTLYLPPGYSEDEGPLPVVMWAYPREFKSSDTAGQVTDSPHRFDWIGWWSPLLWLTQGYAVLDGPTMPIVGEGDEEPNDTYVEQLVMSAEAAVDEVVRRGVADSSRIAIGGHSYGAFMTANLLAHSDLFAAGLARTGAYNRTLTPFGFQSEERTLWEAPDVYFEMSPFMHAHKVNEPLLLIHGEADSNPGTFPMQSERFYNALSGLGGTARLVMLPHESHSYRARESLLHLLWETQEWLGRHVKQAGEND
ncbi:MAG: prolyl oligopeptidase family serine peptidase [Candidatus Eisenbacteria bacterium]|nr:prolyl oligopeptidase family serine peptidase [Candidatus Eisenbacteria bacterium]